MPTGCEKLSSRWWLTGGNTVSEVLSVAAVQVVPVRVGEVDLLVQTVTVAGTEPTSGLGKVSDRIVDAFSHARAAIIEVASSTAEVVEKLANQARRPDQLEVEFGLSFTAKGNVIVAGGEAGAALRVKVVYNARQGV